MKWPLLLLPILSVTLTAQTPPASLHLEIGKDTLALAEPTMLKVTITNLSENGIVIHSRHTFELPYSLKLFLVTPEGEVSRYRTGISISYGPENLIYFTLPPGKQVVEDKMLWWQNIVPSRYVAALQELPSGTYQLYATYHLPSNDIGIYSDTLEFTFLPVEKEHLEVLEDLNHIHGPFYEKETNTRLRRIADSNTPYSEAAWVKLILRTYDYDSLKAEKSRFDEAYPNSPFTPWLLFNQCAFYRMSRPVPDPYANDLPELDSLMELRASINSRSVDILKFRNEIQYLTEQERRER